MARQRPTETIDAPFGDRPYFNPGRWRKPESPSTNVSAIRWVEDEDDPRFGTLYVRFLDQSVYAYYDVGIDVWVDFLSAESPGGFVWEELRDIYDYERIR